MNKKRNIRKVFILVFLISLLSSCSFISLNFNNFAILGDWEREGDYVVTFDATGGYFKDLTGGIWLDAKKNNNILTGEKCYKDITKSDSKNVWKCKIRIYNTASPHETLRWEDCTLTLNSDTDKITVKTASGNFTLRRYE